MDEIEQDLRGLRPGFVASQAVGISMVVLMSIWTGHFMGGFTGSSNPKLEFNWHPLLLTISLIYLYGNGILIYRLGRNERKSKLKIAHATGIFDNRYCSGIVILKHNEIFSRIRIKTVYQSIL